MEPRAMTPALVHAVRPALPDTGRPPLLLLLHGVGGNEAQMAALAEQVDPRFLVLSVRSPLALGPSSYAWFHVAFTPQGPRIDAPGAEAGWKALAAFRDDAVQRYGADPDRVFVAGFSQGGIMALAALLTRPDAFTGAACLSGRLLPEVLPHVAAGVRGKPVLLVHGRQDQTLPLRFAHWARDTLQGLGLDLDYRESGIGHEVTPDSLRAMTAWLSRQLEET